VEFETEKKPILSKKCPNLLPLRQIRRMKKIMPWIGVLALLIGCQNDKDGFTLEGSVSGVLTDSTKVYLQKRDSLGRFQPIDTALIVDEHFEFTGKVEEVDLYTLKFDSRRGGTLAPVILENAEISFKSPIDSLAYMTVKGTEQNEWLMEFMDQTRTMNEIGTTLRDDMRKAYYAQDSVAYAALIEESQELVQKNLDFAKTFIGNHPKSLMSLTLMEELVNRKSLPVITVDSLYQLLDEDLKRRPIGAKIKVFIDKERPISVGAIAPDFIGPDPDGNELILSEVRGKVTLVDFWAAWCKPCRMENPNVKRVYEQYKDKGFTVIGVSLDKNAEEWAEAIAQDGLEWNHVSNLMAWQDPIAKMYNVSSIPKAFLLNEEGKIIGRDLRGAALEQAVAAILD
jgi:thiol-disulfide isomerase/thioredoxin